MRMGARVINSQFVGKLVQGKNGAISWRYADGGRAEAGYKGTAPGDCVCRAVAIAEGLPYEKVYDMIHNLAKRERAGKSGLRSNPRLRVYKTTYKALLQVLGWKWIPTMQIGSGCKVHLRADELPKDRTIIVSLSKHISCVINGVVHDLYDPSREGQRCVYGIWYKGARPEGL
jgi:hypothetical protein